MCVQPTFVSRKTFYGMRSSRVRVRVHILYRCLFETINIILVTSHNSPSRSFCRYLRKSARFFGKRMDG